MSSWVFGHTSAMVTGEDMDTLDSWAEQHGDTFVIRGGFGKHMMITADNRAVAHVLSASYVFQRPPTERRGLRSFLGEGVLWAEGEQHKKQRRIMSPAFGHAQVRGMTPIFLEEAARMCEIWTNKCTDAGGTARIDAMEWLSKAALDIIGRAGFDHLIGALDENGQKSELAEAFEQLLRTDTSSTDFTRNMINNHFPLLRTVFPDDRTRRVANSKQKMYEIGRHILDEKKTAILAGCDKDGAGARDLISLLLRANLASNVDPSQRLTDEEVLAQIPTFLFAGHETTSNTATWAMYSLANNPEMQDKLRREVQTIYTDEPTLDMLNALPYLDQVVRETLRLHIFVPFVTREALKDDVIPLEHPVIGENGQTITHIHIQEGDEVTIPIWLVNRSKSIWGPDATKFRPERWENIPEAAAGIPGVTPGHLSFIGGPRACIGHRFAVAEMKVLLFHIARRFEFKLAVDASEIWSRSAPLLHPQMRSDNSVQMPVLITPIA
ncbi:cytochrome P450 [Auricularia subglabra TFB-10046 SS5]|uniref:Cytochrome P450 n=1 Tax=Auricularia subglabra (strain TFB-10046 / SS5) TaxID=717982 RepID=J0WWA4_AURST|nr:cytochrome P450 [Auricularia subglabra TFB-10046 SS5]